jgi:hypothetical protein
MPWTAAAKWSWLSRGSHVREKLLKLIRPSRKRRLKQQLAARLAKRLDHGEDCHEDRY